MGKRYFTEVGARLLPMVEIETREEVMHDDIVQHRDAGVRQGELIDNAVKGEIVTQVIDPNVESIKLRQHLLGCQRQDGTHVGIWKPRLRLVPYSHVRGKDFDVRPGPHLLDDHGAALADRTVARERRYPSDLHDNRRSSTWSQEIPR